MSVLLRVENLRAGYSQPGLEVIAARDIGFELGEGEFLGLAGVRLRENYSCICYCYSGSTCKVFEERV